MSTHESPQGLDGVLTDWLPAQRWYGGKGRQITAVEVMSTVTLRVGDPQMHHIVARVTASDSSVEQYQLLVGVRTDMPDRLDHAGIGTLPDGRCAYDAAQDTELTALLLERLAEGGSVDGINFSQEPSVRTGDVSIDASQPSRVSSAEQSNTSLVFGSQYILKLFRRLSPGVNPDLEVQRALSAVGCSYIARPLAAIEGDVDGETMTYAMLQDYVANAADGWHMATTSVRDLYAEGDLHADEVGGDFAGEAHRLGIATAAVHSDLAAALGSRQAGGDASRGTAQQMRDRLAAALAVVPELRPHAEGLRAAYDEVAGLTERVHVQRVHGDFHLGQVLRSMTGWVIIDFEGEPARPFAERRALMSPLRDIAGMLRSFDYASRHLLADRPGEPHLEYRANEWAERNRDAFCTGYAEASGSDPRKQATLLRAFELDKAVYEMVYEARNRPSWLAIPLTAIARLAG